MIPTPSAESAARTAPARRAAVPVLALDVPDAASALVLAERLPDAEWVKVGLQLFTAAGPAVVRELRER
ncbi:MAG TPA: orotidine 5'-phosphate decarboxylase / HUMPS family protein, partial [Longimicrobiaceae bacterium]|nr:orotidine 5'-phosphate decarboxylase / HUMPS family protein [Longimicrobiaceae bacterium]